MRNMIGRQILRKIDDIFPGGNSLENAFRDLAGMGEERILLEVRGHRRRDESRANRQYVNS